MVKRMKITMILRSSNLHKQCQRMLNKFLSEIDTSINKKNSLSDSRPSIDETDEVEPPKPAKAAEPVSKIEEKKLGASNSPVAGQEATNDQKEVKELSVEEYNKSIEDLNDKLFVKVDDPILSNSEDNNENVSDTNLKVDDYEEEKEAFTNEKKFEDFNQSEDFVQETRSEEGKEDQNRLEKESDQSEKCVEEPTNLRNSEKGAKYRQQNKNKHNKNKQNSAMKKEDKLVKLEELKESALTKKDCESDLEDGFQSPKNEDNCIGDINKHLSYTSEAKSTRSEDKNSRKKTKCVNSTNPTSETSSFKDSSIASNQGAKFYSSENRNKKEKEPVHSANWIQTERKSKKPKHPKKKRPLKSDRPKYHRPQPEETQEKKEKSNKSDTPSDSIWNEESVKAIFSPQEPKKKPKKSKANTKQSLKQLKSHSKSDVSGQQKISPNDPSKEHRKGSSELDKKKSKETKSLAIEEKKVDLTIKPTNTPTSFASNQANFYNDAGEEEKAVPCPPTPECAQNSQKIKRLRSEVSHHNIPEETVSSFYQCEEEYGARPFTKNRSQNYTKYSQDMTGYPNDKYDHYQSNMYVNEEE